MGSALKKPKTPKTPAPPKMDTAGDIQKYVDAYGKAMPSVYNFEEQFRPQFQGLNLGDVNAFLKGIGGQQGIMGLSSDIASQTGQQLTQLRGEELGQMAGQAGSTRGLMQALSPEQQAITQAAIEEADRANAAAKGLSPQEQRLADQQAREAFQSSGRLGGNASIVQEAMNRESMLTGKRSEASRAGAQAFDMAGQFYTNPGLQLLGSAPLSYQTGQQMLNMGVGAIGAGRPQLINPDTGANLGMQYTTNLFNQQAANTQANAARSAGMMGAIGTIGGAAATAAIPLI
jgi:ribosomal protein S7